MDLNVTLLGMVRATLLSSPTHVHGIHRSHCYESDGFCASLPYFLYGFDFKSIEKIISLVTVSKISRKYALAKFHLIDLALKGAKNPINEFIKKFRKNYPKYWSVLSKTI